MSLLITLGRVYPKGFVPKLRCSLSWAEAGKSIIEVTKKWKEGISSYSYVTVRLNHVNIEIRIVCIFYLSLFFFFLFFILLSDRIFLIKKGRRGKSLLADYLQSENMQFLLLR